MTDREKTQQDIVASALRSIIQVLNGSQPIDPTGAMHVAMYALSLVAPDFPVCRYCGGLDGRHTRIHN